MNYANIDKFEYRNGEGIGVSLFVSGCHFHCKDCFNREAWGFNYGEEWTEETKEYLINLLEDEHITRLSILGGEPLCDENVKTILEIVLYVKKQCPDIKIWIYTGYETKMVDIPIIIPKYDDGSRYAYFSCEPLSHNHYDTARSLAIQVADVLVDGRFEIEQRNLSLKFKGSENQRIIDVRQSVHQHKLILREE